jgi:uncharacterized lipoprotein YddW (UPF0748 family)
MRGLWVVRTGLVSPGDVDRVVDDAAAAGFNALLVQVRGRGDAFYASRLAPRSPILWKTKTDFDPLARLLERARGRGLEVHAWVNVLLTAHFGQPVPSGHVVERHPEWLMVPRSAARAALGARGSRLLALVGQAARAESGVEGYYLSPSAPGVAEHLEEVVKELLRGYAVQGIHYDFARYPGPEFDYSRAALESFRARRGGGDLPGLPARFPAAWDDHRREVLTGLVRRLTRAARAQRPGLVVSAAVVADLGQAWGQKYQAWPAWLAEGLLQAVTPMAYTPDNQVFRAQLEQARSRARPGQRVWAGIGAYRLPLSGVIEKIRLARETGVAGVVLFSHESLAPVDLERLRAEAFPPPRAAPADLAVGAAGAR